MPELLINSIVSGRNQEPYVQIMLDGKMAQLTPAEAQSFALQLMTAAEAAIGDAFLVHFMGGAAGGAGEREALLGKLLIGFRDYRMNVRGSADPLKWGEIAEWTGGEPPAGP
jgi:hypothetical protein